MMRNPAAWRWSHSRHHSNTIIVGRDPEIAVMRPPQLARLLLNFFGLPDVYQALLSMLRYAAGKLDADIQDYVPATEHNKICTVARIWPALWQQLRYQDYFLKRELPPSAKPYRVDFQPYALPPVE